MAIILTSLGSSTVMLMKMNMRMNYQAEMNVQADRALQTLTTDVRDANKIHSLSNNDFVLIIPPRRRGAGGAGLAHPKVKYEYDSTAATFSRIKGPETANEEVRVLLEGVSNLNIIYYDMRGETTSTKLDARKIEINATMVRGDDNGTQVSRDVTTAIYMRNKRGGN